MTDLSSLRQGIPLDKLSSVQLPNTGFPQAPNRNPQLSPKEFRQAIKNLLRYFPQELHRNLIPLFADQLRNRGHVWMEYLRPNEYEIKAYPIDQYPAKCVAARAIQLMIMNNLDYQVAQYPDQLITYGGNGSVFSNWAQYHLTMKYLSEMEEDQTLIMYSGHPMGLFPSSPSAPRLIISNGQVIPNYGSKALYEKFFAMGTTIYGQMTAGSYCYIGPQGIVHGTTLTLLNACRKYLGSEELQGKVFITSGLGGMSGAQGKAVQIAKCIGVVAEIKETALLKRFNQGWVDEITRSVDETIERIRALKAENQGSSIAFFGNIVDLLERLAECEDLLVDLLSDQTSLHDPFGGGYYPVGFTIEESETMIYRDSERFKQVVQESLVRHANAINRLTEKGAKFWDYGNSFLLECKKAQADVLDPLDQDKFRYPSYVQDIMGDIFSLGFGPFRWICTSCKEEDLTKTDKIAEDVIIELMNHPDCPEETKQQYRDNLKWIVEANKNRLVVGSQARILYIDTLGRIELAIRFNEAIKQGEISAPIVLSRDHHDVSGADSPYRETSNIYDGSQFTSDMAVQTALGNSARGATWVSLHHGGGVGWGEVINTGFGFVLDGSDEAQNKAMSMLDWDTCNGIARRCWSGHPYARIAIQRRMRQNEKLNVTLPYSVSDELDIPDSQQFKEMEGNMQVLQGINTLIDSFKKNVYNKQRPPAKNLELNKYVQALRRRLSQERKNSAKNGVSLMEIINKHKVRGVQTQQPSPTRNGYNEYRWIKNNLFSKAILEYHEQNDFNPELEAKKHQFLYNYFTVRFRQEKYRLVTQVLKEKDLQDDNECMDINIVRAQPAINKNNRKIIRSRWDRTVEKIDEDIQKRLDEERKDEQIRLQQKQQRLAAFTAYRSTTDSKKGFALKKLNKKANIFRKTYSQGNFAELKSADSSPYITQLPVLSQFSTRANSRLGKYY